MPRGLYNRKAALARKPAQSVAVLAPSLTTLLAKLSAEEQREVKSEGTKLAHALLHYGQSKLAVGEHLTKLQGILEPHNLFARFLRFYHFNKRTAYRYIAGYKNAKAKLPEAVLKAAMSRGVNIIGESEVKPLGIYTAAVEKLPPPQNANEVQANTWLDQLETVRKETRAESAAIPGNGGLFALETGDPQTMLKECFRFVTLRFKRLPNNAKTRAAWIRSLVGMLLSTVGIGAQSFNPVAVPEGYIAERGRPAVAKEATA